VFVPAGDVSRYPPMRWRIVAVFVKVWPPASIFTC
jgi:hypothetical protein